MDHITSMTPRRQIITPRFSEEEEELLPSSLLYAPSRNMEGEARHRIQPQGDTNARRILKFPILSNDFDGSDDDTTTSFSLKRKRSSAAATATSTTTASTDQRQRTTLVREHTQQESDDSSSSSSKRGGSFRPITPTNLSEE